MSLMSEFVTKLTNNALGGDLRQIKIYWWELFNKIMMS